MRDSVVNLSQGQGGYISGSRLPVRLKALSERTRVPQAAYFREAIEDLLTKYEEPKKKAGK
jgi:hypothetical protein